MRIRSILSKLGYGVEGGASFGEYECKEVASGNNAEGSIDKGDGGSNGQ